MAAQSKSMSGTNNTNNIGTQGSLFDDDEGALGGICFDLDPPQLVTSDKKCNTSSWCKSSSSSASCCSLCRPPTISEAEDNSNMCRLKLFSEAEDDSTACRHTSGASPSFQSMPTDTQGSLLVSLQRGSFDFDNIEPQLNSFSGCNHKVTPSCNEHRERPFPFQVPIKSISVPRSCFYPSATAKVDPSRASAVCSDFLSTSFLPDDALCQIVKFLDVASLIRLRECNRKLCDAASKNSAGWENHCLALWSSKANVCSLARDLLTESNKMNNEETSENKYAAMEAYKISVADAATREEISIEEICFDGSPDKSGVIWSFRFKESAGQGWTSWDPWWNGQVARKLVFLRDGTVKQVYPQGLESGAKDHNGTVLYDVFSERTVHRDGADVPAPRREMRWRFVDRPLDLASRPLGAYVRITVGSRDVPTYVVHRSSNGNWGFILENCWGVYASFELAPPVPFTSVLARRSQRSLRRTRNGSRWDLVSDEDTDSDSEGDSEFEYERMRNVRRRIDLFVEETSMTQNGDSQWREALLYNLGALTLPEGNAVGEFNTLFRFIL